MVNTLFPQRNYREISNYFLLSTLISLTAVIGLVLFQFALPRARYANLGPVSIFAVNEPVFLTLNQHGQTLFLWVVNLDGDIRVFDARATHPSAHDRNCVVKWISEASSWSPATNYFADPCVGGAWNIDGTHQWGPAPRGLDMYSVEIRDGELWIDIMYPQKGEFWRR